MKSTNWEPCVQAFKYEHKADLVMKRRYTFDFIDWLKQQKLIGIYDGCFAFPLHDGDGGVIGVHYKTGEPPWQHAWFTDVPAKRRICPLLISDDKPSLKQHWVFESYWDAFAVMDKHGWHHDPKRLLAEVCLVITRGSTNGKLVRHLAEADGSLFAFKQNDQPTLEKPVPAADEWMDDIVNHAGCNVYRVATPPEYDDINDWTQKGATDADILQAINEAASVSQLSTSAEADNTSLVELAGQTAFPLEAGEFPMDALNPTMRAIAAESAQVHRIAPEVTALAAMATMAGALGKAWIVTGAVDGHQTHGNVYTFIAAPKSYGKGAASHIAKPLIDASLALQEHFTRETFPAEQAKLFQIDQRLFRLKQSARKSQQIEENPADLSKLLKRKSEIEAMLKAPLPSYWIGSATGAALVESLARNNETLFSFSPEAGDMVRIALGRYSGDNRADFDVLLSGYSVETLGESRISRGQHNLRPCISTLWFCQPLILREILISEEALERGLIARMVGCLVEVQEIPEDDGTARSIQTNTGKGWNELIMNVLAMREKSPKPNLLECSPEAREAFRQFHNEAVRLRNTEFQDIEGELGRWRENAIRIAVGQRVADELTGLCPRDSPITLDQAERAIKLARWSHIRTLAFINPGRLERRQDEMESIITRLKKFGTEMTLRDVERRCHIPSNKIRRLAIKFPDLLRVVEKKPKVGRSSQTVQILC